mmetsp:Transcript_22101/g.71519  ORF Transcript_22101/g.71519 Transcript_22101/m.71519 type:complete len:247 (+) Transcript_22101:2119-2859(+)
MGGGSFGKPSGTALCFAAATPASRRTKASTRTPACAAAGVPTASQALPRLASVKEASTTVSFGRFAAAFFPLVPLGAPPRKGGAAGSIIATRSCLEFSNGPPNQHPLLTLNCSSCASLVEIALMRIEPVKTIPITRSRRETESSYCCFPPICLNVQARARMPSSSSSSESKLGAQRRHSRNKASPSSVVTSPRASSGSVLGFIACGFGKSAWSDPTAGRPIKGSAAQHMKRIAISRFDCASVWREL